MSSNDDTFAPRTGVRITGISVSPILQPIPEGGGPVVMLTNEGAVPVLYRQGKSDVVVTETNGFPILPGEKQPYRCPEGVTHISVMCPAGTGILAAHWGDGT